MKNVQDAKKIIGILRSVRWIKVRALSHMQQINDVVSVASAITSATEQEESHYSEIPEDDGSFSEESLENMFVSVFPDDFIQEKSIIINGDQKTLQDISELVDASRDIINRLDGVITEEMEASVVTTKADRSGNFESNLDELREFCESLINSFDGLSPDDKENLTIVITDGVNELIRDLSSASGIEKFKKLHRVYLKNKDSLTLVEPQEETISEELRRRNLLYAARCRRLKELADAGDERAERLYLKMKCRQEEPPPQEEAIIFEESISEEPPVEAEPEISLEFSNSLDETVYITSERDSEIIKGYFEASESEVFDSDGRSRRSFFLPKESKIIPQSTPNTEFVVLGIDKYKSAVGMNPKGELRRLYQSIPDSNDPGSFYDEIGSRDFLDFDGSIFSGKFDNMEDAIGITKIPGSDSESFLLEVDDAKIAKIKGVLDEEVISIIESSNRIYDIPNLSDSDTIDADIAKKINVYRRFLIKKIDYFFASIKSRDLQVVRYLNANYAGYEKADLNSIRRRCLITNFYIDKNPVVEDERFAEFMLLKDERLRRGFVNAIVNIIRPGLRNNVFERRYELILESKNSNVKYLQDGFSEGFEKIINSEISKKILELSLGIDLRTKTFSDGSHINIDASKTAFDIASSALFHKLKDRMFVKTEIKRYLNKCPVCNKEVYRKYSAKSRMGGVEDSEGQGRKAKDPMNEIKIDTYSLVRETVDGGGVITFEDLIDAGPFDLSKEEIPEIKALEEKLGQRIKNIWVPKTWEQIEEDWSSGDYLRHVGALKRKSLALKRMGGKKLSTPLDKIATSRIRCPFGPEIDPASLKFDESAGRGLHIKPSEILTKFIDELQLDKNDEAHQKHIREMNEVVNKVALSPSADTRSAIISALSDYAREDIPNEVSSEDRRKQAVAILNGEAGESEEISDPFSCGLSDGNQVISGLSLYLDDAVKSGSMTQAARDKMLELSSRQASGGFRFSSRSFVCPSEIEIESPDDALRNIEKYKLLAMPIPVADTAQDTQGSRHPVERAVDENKKILSLYCGAKTSISQFDRAKFANKLEDLIKDTEKYNKTIESMIQMGVDASDILPFVMIKHSYNESRPEGSSADFSFDDLVTDDLISRSQKISLLLKEAMATSATKTKSEQLKLDKYFVFIEDIELKCVHGHNFKVSDSISFASRYIDVPMTRGNVLHIVKKNILSMSGKDQLDAILKMRDAPIKALEQEAKEGFKSYTDFVFRQDPISSVYFPNPGSKGSLRYEVGRKTLSMYPMSSPIVSSPIDSIESNVPGQALLALFKGVEGGRIKNQSVVGRRSESGEKLVQDHLENIEAQGSLGISAEQALIGRTSDPEKLITAIEEQKEISKKNETLMLALMQSYIISIQELLIASTATNAKTATIWGSDIGKKKVVKGENIEIPDFDQNLKRFVAKIVSGASETIKDEDDQYRKDEDDQYRKDEDDQYREIVSEIVSDSIGNIRQKLIRDVGGDARAFIYSIRGAFKGYLHRLIVGGILNALPGDRADASADQSVQDIRSRVSALKIEDVVSAFSNIFYVDKADIPEGSDQSSETIEASEGKKFIKDMAKTIGGLSGGNVGPMVMNVTEVWLGKQIVTAATAFYIAERLSSIYNKFFSKNSVRYIGYEPLISLASNNGEMTPEAMVSITIENLLLNDMMGSSISADCESLINDVRERFGRKEGLEHKEDDFKPFVRRLANDIIPVIDGQKSAIKELGGVHNGAAYACRSSHYQSAALDYIKSVYKEVLASEASTASEKSYSESIINRVLANVKNIEVSLAPPSSSSKYSSYFAEPDNSHILLPSITHPILTPSPKALSGGLSKPIYVIKDVATKGQGGRREKGYILGISRELIATYDYALLIHAADLDKFLAISQMAESDAFSDLHKELYNNGWRLFVGRGSKIPGAKASKDSAVSIANHPNTFISTDDAGNISGYRNDSLGIDTESGIHIGQYGQGSPSGKAYPPDPGADCGIGIPLPILLNNLESIRAPKDAVNVSLADVPFEIQIPGGDVLEINLSDLLMRDPPEAAANILFQIDKEYKEFWKKHKGLDSDGQIRAKESFSKYAKSKMNEYRSLPLYIALESGARTLRDGEKFSGNTGIYVPLINPVLANMLISNPCFRAEYAGSSIIPVEIDEYSGISEAIDITKEFIVSLHGYDKLAELMNGYRGERRYVSEGEPLAGADLLDPYDLIVRRKKISMSALWGEARDDSSPVEVIKDDKTGVVSGMSMSSSISERFSKSFDVRIPEWRHYTPPFRAISVSGNRQGNEAGFGIPKFILDGPIFRRKGERDFESIRDLAAESDILDIGDLKSLVSTRMPEGKGEKVIRTYGFSDSLEKFFSKKFDAIESFMEKYEESLITHDVYNIYDPKKAMIFDSAFLFNKISSSIICKNFIKKSEKYRTDIFEEIIIRDEALIRLLDSIK